jgi:NAD(P)-dependent dehydrogenase (short-subunit alcohol dehydrogenase family)
LRHRSSAARGALPVTGPVLARYATFYSERRDPYVTEIIALIDHNRREPRRLRWSVNNTLIFFKPAGVGGDPMNEQAIAKVFDMTGKVALVTGGSRGLGREMVLAFAQAGADVIIASRKLDACEELAREVESTTGQKAMAVACHTGDWGDMERLYETAYAYFDHVDVLVNNAGMSPLYDTIADVTEALYDKVLNVNMKGHFRLTALVGTRMAEGDGGSIMFVSSGGALTPHPGIIPYAAAKAGIHAMTTGFAWAFAPKVRVNCLMPGPFLTDISKAWDLEAFHERVKTSQILQRGGEPREVVGAALFLASNASSFTTGTVVSVTGGSEFKSLTNR